MDQKAAILNDPGMRSIYINPDTNDTWKEGDTYTRLNFANTLERIAKLGSEASPCSTNLILSKFIQNIIKLYLEEFRAVQKQDRLKTCNFDLSSQTLVVVLLACFWVCVCFRGPSTYAHL